MTKLPQMQAGMNIDQALYLELLNILVEQQIITEDEATSRYKVRLKEIENWVR